MCGRTRSNKPAHTDERGIDACLSDLIRLLNAEGVDTTMSCCQHGAGKPWVVMSLPAVRNLLKSRAVQWIEEMHSSNNDNWWWRVTFCAEVCTPPRMDPCRNKTREEIRLQRCNFGFKRP